MSKCCVTHHLPETEVLALLSAAERPLSLVIVGGSQKLNHLVIETLVKHFDGCSYFAVKTVADIEKIPAQGIFETTDCNIVHVQGAMGASCDFRFTLTNRLHQAGAAAVALFWVHCDPDDDPSGVERNLRSYPPTMDDLDYNISLTI